MDFNYNWIEYYNDGFMVETLPYVAKCPVCNGSGKYEQYITTNLSGKVYTSRTCHGCGGKGWILIPSPYRYITKVN